jgi:hypothetical protein
MRGVPMPGRPSGKVSLRWRGEGTSLIGDNFSSDAAVGEDLEQ